MLARSQPVNIKDANWPFFVSVFLMLIGGLFLWSHFFDILPALEGGHNTPVLAFVPLHSWALINLVVWTLVFMLGLVSMSCPGVTRSTAKNPLTREMYQVLVMCILVADCLLLVTAAVLDVRLLAWMIFLLVVQLPFVGWHAYLIRKLYLQER